MALLRAFAAVLIAGSLTGACTSSGGGSPSTSASGSATTPGVACTSARAVTARFTLIDASGFTPSCVKIKVKSQFLFINNVAKGHSVTTQKGAPTSFDVQLPRKTSTYATTFSKKGKYVVVDKTTDTRMTLFVA